MWNWMMLGLESNRVIGLRIAKLMRGGKRQTPQPEPNTTQTKVKLPLEAGRCGAWQYEIRDLLALERRGRCEVR